MKKILRRAIQSITELLPIEHYEVTNNISAQAKISVLKMRERRIEVTGDKNMPMPNFDKPPYRVTSFHKVNHTRRMKRRYLKDGINGINDYIKSYGLPPVQSIHS